MPARQHIALALALALALPLACGGCAGWQSALDPAGLPAFPLYRLMVGIMLACAIIWVLVIAVLALALWRRRTTAPRPPTRERRMTIVVATALAATVVIISAFTFASFMTTRALESADQDALVIRVRGFQWWWEVNYFDAKTGETFATANEIHVPVGRTVRLQLVGADVIHTFWVPSLAGKQDLIPGRDNELTFVAQRPGVYRGQCAEFCGLQHARMALIVVALPADEFQSWTVAQRADAVAPVSDELARGHDVFLAKACSACHTIRGTSATGITGPDLTHVGSRRTIAAGVLETTRGSLAAWIADPQTIKPGNNMPMVPLSAEELRAVSAYMASLK
jgi:cytochrome c oxidase subunit 2